MCSWPCIVMLYFRRSMLCFMTWRYRCCWFFFAFAFIFERDCSFHLTKLLSLHLKQLNNGKWLLLHNVFPGNSLCGWRCGWAWLCLFCFCIVIDLHRSFWRASKRLLLCLKPRCNSSPVHCLCVCCFFCFQPSVKIYTLIWAFFLHLGSTNTSRVCRMYSDIHQEIERCLNEKLEEKERERRQALRPLEGDGVVLQDEKVKLPRVHFYFLLLNFCIFALADWYVARRSFLGRHLPRCSEASEHGCVLRIYGWRRTLV